MKVKRAICIAGMFGATVAAIEIMLRVFLGLGYPPLTQHDPDVGYYFKGNQDLKRFGNRIFYNNYHQRSENLLDNPAYRILMIGDSVTNGGALTDQDDTITEILERMLNAHRKEKGEVLSASAGGWGIGNEYEYIKKFGIFNSNIVIIQIGTRDLLQPKGLGRDSIRMPTHYPVSAISELFVRYLHPRMNQWFGRKDKVNKRGQSLAPEEQLIRNLNNVETMLKEVSNQNAQILILLTPGRIELKDEASLDEKRAFKDLLNKYQIPYINLLDGKYNFNKKNFRDKVHLSKEGNYSVASVLFEYIKSMV